MALEIFKLVGSIFVNNDEANKSISQTDEKAEGLGKKMLSGVGTAAKWGAGIVTAAAGAATAMIGIATNTADAADVIDKASQRVGITAEEYQKLAYAADMSGVSTSTLETAAKKLATTMPEANLTDVISQLAAMENQEERTAEAIRLLGKSAAYDLTPLLNEGADGVAGLMKECEDLGMVMSGDTVSAGAALGDTISAIKQSFGGMVNQLGGAVMPIVQKFAGLILDSMPMINQLIGKLAPVLVGMMENLLPPLMDMAEKLLPIIVDLISQILPVLVEVISAVLPVIIDLLMMILPPLIEIITAILPPLLDIIKALLPILTLVIDLLKPILDLFISLLAPIIEIVMSAITPLIEILSMLITTALDPIIPLIEVLASVLTGTLGAAFKVIGGIVTSVMSVFKGLISFITGIFTGSWTKAFEGLSDIVKNIFEAMTGIIKKPINFIIEGINGFIRGLNKIKIPDWVPGVGGKGLDISEIPMLAKGGTVGAGQLFIANEQEPELIGNIGNRTAVANNSQMLEVLTMGVFNAVREAMAGFAEQIISAVKENGGGDIVIPIHIGGRLLDEFIITAKERVNYKSGGYANA